MLPSMPVDFRMAPGYSADSLVPAISSAHLSMLERQAEDDANRKRDEIVSNLASHIRRCFDEAKTAKSAIEAEFIAALNQRAGRYEPEVLAEINRFGGSDMFVRVTDQKCVAAASWIRDVLSLDRPWGLDPTPIPDLSPSEVAAIEAATQQAAWAEIQQQAMAGIALPSPDVLREQVAQVAEKAKASATIAREKAARTRADKMAKAIEDYLDESDFKNAMADAIDTDLTTFGTAILKGPVIRSRRKLAWQETATGQWSPVEVEETYPDVERVSPLALYPSADAIDTQSAAYLVELYKLRRSDLRAFKGIDGYNDAEIDKILDEFGQTGHREAQEIDSAADSAAKRSDPYLTSQTNIIDALIFFGEVPGSLLLDWGIKSVEKLAEYAIEAWMVGSHVFRVDIKEPHEVARPYHKAVYRSRPGSFWGTGVPFTIDYLQRGCNAAGRALVNNMAIASGPQVGVDMEQMPSGDDGSKMWPWKVWRFKSGFGQSDKPPITFFQPDLRAAELMAIYEKFSGMADDVSGIPRYVQGDASVGGAGRTASGLSMLMGAAGKTVKSIVANIDQGLIEPLITAMFRYAMLYHPDPSLKGDVKVVAKGSTALLVREQAQVRRNEFLRATNNPVDLAIMGEERRSELLRSVAETLSMDPDQIAPTREEMEKRKQAQQQALLAQQQGQFQARALAHDGSPVAGQDARLFNPVSP
ncbi:MAG: hypothetical protein ABTR07_17580 [Candidatus Competibacter denitrificans]